MVESFMAGSAWSNAQRYRAIAQVEVIRSADSPGDPAAPWELRAGSELVTRPSVCSRARGGVLIPAACSSVTGRIMNRSTAVWAATAEQSAWSETTDTCAETDRALGRRVTTR